MGSATAVGLGVANGMRAFDGAMAAVSRTQDVLLAASRLEGDLQAAVSQARGFRLSGTAEDLALFAQATRRIDADIGDLRAMTADDPDQAGELTRLAPLIAERLTILRQIAGIAVDDIAPAAPSGDPYAMANAAMSRVAASLDAIKREAEGLLVTRRDAASRTRDLAIATAGVGTGLLSASLLMMASLFVRRRRERLRVGELAQVNQALERRVEERTAALRQLAEALRRGEAEQRLYLEHARFAIMILREREDGSFVVDYVNPACEALYCRPRAAFLGRTATEIWSAPTAHEIERRWRDCVRTGKPFEGVVERETPRGTKYIDGMLEPFASPDGKFRQVMFCATDATARVEMARRVREQAAYEREILEREAAFFRNAEDVLFVLRVERDGANIVYRYEAVSPKFESATGISPDTVLGRRLEECLEPKLAEKVIARNKTCLERDATYKFTDVFDLPIGPRNIEGAVTPVKDPATGQIMRVVGWVRDITERVKREEAGRQAQKMEALGRLAAGVAHDFNNLLQSMTGSLELAIEEIPEDHQARDLIAGALESSRLGGTLTQPLLTYAREQVLWPRAIETENFLADMRKVIASVVGDGIVARVRLSPRTPPIYADPGQLQAAILNLATNAAHAMPTGGTLTLEACELCDGPQRSVVLTVIDTGTGMDAATLARATDPFFSTKGLLGTGLGLSLVKGFAEQSGGTLRITSETGRGTRVELELPTAACVPETAGRKPFPWISGRILLVDDAEAVLRVTSGILTKAGLEVVRATSAREALTLIAGGDPIDAIVSDFSMPEINGADLIGRIRRVRPGVPALVITGFSPITASLALPADVEVLRKPFDRVQLLDMLQRMMIRNLQLTG